MQPQDRGIVVAGATVSSFEMTVTQLQQNSSAPDPAFRSDGTATIRLPFVLTMGAALQPSGRIVVKGSSDRYSPSHRLNPTGSLDTTFGAGGKATVDFGAATFAHAIALQPNGRIVVAGQKTAGEDFAVARLLG